MTAPQSTAEGVGPAVAPITRRERQRLATHAEIVTTARRLLSARAPMSLRAVAQEMGMTPPALYRYVDGYDELIALVSEAIFDDVLSRLVEARDSVDQDDPAGQLVVSAVAFRSWALEHREEFGHVFANRDTADTAHSHEPGNGGFSFNGFFTDLYLRVRERYPVDIPPDDQLPPRFVAALHSSAADATCAKPISPEMPPGLAWFFVRGWARLYGMVTLEVFGHLDAGLIESGEMFEAMLQDSGRELGLETEWPRIRTLVAAELSPGG